MVQHQHSFVDTHVHFWDLSHPQLRYIWLETDAASDAKIDWSAREREIGVWAAIKAQRYWPEDFLAETRFANVVGIIHVQAAIGSEDPVEETKWLQAFADRLGVPQGIVAYTNLGATDVQNTLQRHARHANLCGIRDIRYDSYFTDSAWRRGYALLERFDLVCCDDPVLEQMGEAARLAADFPGTIYCVDHAGFPRERSSEYFDHWRRNMRKIAAVENTIVKVSGLGMCDHGWTVDSLRPWILECIDAWGTERVVFGTNWPVDRLYSSYRDVVDAYTAILSEFSPAEQAALLADNALRIFGIQRDI